MKTSAAGRALIEAREGRRLLAYRDQKGILTIGVGHTGRMSPPAVTQGMTITADQCDDFLAADLAPVEAVITSCVDVPLSQNEFDALASLGFNIGPGGLRRSLVVRRLNLGDVRGAADAFLNWEKPPALAARRRSERAQFLKPEPAEPDVSPRGSTAAAARAHHLETRAQATKARALSAQTGAGLAMVAAATTAAVTHGSRPILALIGCGLLLVVGVAATITALVARRLAQTLRANAAIAARDAGLATASTALVDILKS